jgi:cell division septation protein DedD
VLGNKQLLTVFFIVVVLFGIFATMGYIVGRSSASPEESSGKEAAPLVVEPAKSLDSPRPELGAESAPSSGGADSPDARAAAPDHRPTPTPPAAQVPPAPSGSPLFIEPSGGQTFLQVMAVARADAELVTEVLRKKGFPAAVAAGPSASIFRVLVGPLSDTAAVAQTKIELEAAGFKNTIVRKY